MPYRDSVPVTTAIELQGVWVMDPGSGGQESARQYPYGSAQREEAVDPLEEVSFYAGRVSPVADYGEHEAYAFAVTLDIPHGPTWRTDLVDLQSFATAKRVLHVRDNRGRAVYGTLNGFRVRDTSWGSQVSFTVERRDWVTETIA